MNKNFIEMQNIKKMFNSGNIAAGITGARASLSEGGRLSVVLHFASTVALPATISVNFLQHTAASAGSSKAISHANPYYYKKGSATYFTKVIPGSASDVIDISSLFGDVGGILVLEILATNMDFLGGYSYASLDIAAIEDVVGYATLEEQDITFTAVSIGLDGEDISIVYADTETAGSESVAVVGNQITVGMEDGVSTATQIKAAIDASDDALELISATITGTAGDVQNAFTEEFLVAPAAVGVSKIAGGMYVLSETRHNPCFDIVF